MLGIAYQDPALFFFLFFLSSGQPIANRVIGHLSFPVLLPTGSCRYNGPQSDGGSCMYFSEIENNQIWEFVTPKRLRSP